MSIQGPWIDPSLLRFNPYSDPETAPWIRALAMTYILQRLQRFVGTPVRMYGQADHVREAAQMEREMLMRDNAIFADLPRLGFTGTAPDIGVYWEGYPAASLPLPSHPLLWEFLETRMVPGSRNIVRWHQNAPRYLVETIKDMEADPEGRALLVDFDAWTEKRK